MLNDYLLIKSLKASVRTGNVRGPEGAGVTNKGEDDGKHQTGHSLLRLETLPGGRASSRLHHFISLLGLIALGQGPSRSERYTPLSISTREGCY